MEHKTEITLNLKQALPVISLSGEITGEMEHAIFEKWESIPDEKKSRVIFDFHDADYINSSGIGIMIQLATSSSENNHQIEFANLSGHLSKVMELVGLLEFVTVHKSLMDAFDQES